MSPRIASTAAVLSVLLHGAALWLLLLHPSVRVTPDSPPTFEVEMVDQAPETRGDAPANPLPAPPAPPAPSMEAPAPPPPAPVIPPAHAAPPAPVPAPTPARAPAPTARPAPLARASVNLGDADQDQDGLRVTGDNVVPPRPDAAIHNRPPRYPADAARRGAHGTVSLIIHISEAGIPSGIDLAQSSGDASLDSAAIDAVALWRFQPARNNGMPVPFDYPIDISFRR